MHYIIKISLYVFDTHYILYIVKYLRILTLYQKKKKIYEGLTVMFAIALVDHYKQKRE